MKTKEQCKKELRELLGELNWDERELAVKTKLFNELVIKYKKKLEEYKRNYGQK